MTAKAHNLGEMAQQVWATKNIAEKKTLLHDMVDDFKFKGKQDHFRVVIEGTDKAARLDKLAADLALADTDKVVQF
jgi:hypothetical protein